MTTQEKTKLNWVQILAYAAVWIGWGTTYLAIRIGVQEVGPAIFLGVRFAISTVAFIPIVYFSRADKKASWREVRDSALQGIMLLIGGLLPLSYAERDIPSNVTAIAIGCAPIGFAIFDRLINGTKINRFTLFGIIAGVAGVTILGLHQSAEQVGNRGAILFLPIGVIIWSFASVISKKMHPVKNRYLHVMIQYAVVSVLFLLFGRLFEGMTLQTVTSLHYEVWNSLLYIALLPSIVSYLGYMWLIENEPSRRVATYAFVNPIVAVVAGAVILNEPMTKEMYIALSLILTGTFLSMRKTVAVQKSQ